MSIRKGMLLLLLTLAKLSYAQSTLQPDSLVVSAEWLYMQLSISQPEYVINSSSQLRSIGDRIATAQNWYSGYRAKGSYGIQDGMGELFLRWTYFPEILEQDKESGSFLQGILNHPSFNTSDPGTATIKDKFAITTYELLLKQKVIRRPCYSLSLNGGVEYLHLNFEESLLYPGATIVRRLPEYRSRVKGVGPEMGVDYIYGFSKCLNFVSSIHGAGLLGLMHKSFIQKNQSDATLIEIENDKYWSFILSMDLRLGFKYSLPINLRQLNWRMSCWNLDVELGYEILSFFNSFERIYFVGQG